MTFVSQKSFEFDQPIPKPADLQKHHKGAQAYHAGLAAEEQVARDYSRRGYRVIAKRWRGQSGEIDVILSSGSGFVFVEVKKSKNFSNAFRQVSTRQMHRICQAAEEFSGAQPLGSLTDIRIDVAAVDQHGQIEIVENATMMG